MVDTTTWGASVDDVSALASYVPIEPDGTAPDSPTDPYNRNTVRRITRAQVEVWIQEVSALAGLQVAALDRLVEGSRCRVAIEGAMRSAVANGAASYVVGAATPAKASPNENTSYQQVLWNRYLEHLAGAVGALERCIDAGGEDVIPEVLVVRPAAIRMSFPAPLFPDTMRF